MRLSRAAFACLLAGSTVYCRAAEESRLDLVYSHSVQVDSSAAGPAQAQVPPRAGTCTVVINTPNDVRQNKDTLGTTFRDNPIVSSQSPVIWLEAALLDLTRQGFSTVPGKASGGPSASRTATLSADLYKLYVWNHSLNLHATLVIKAKILGGNGAALEKSYRVNSTKLNWWNGDGEFIETINLAAGRLLEQIAADIAGICGSKAGA